MIEMSLGRNDMSAKFSQIGLILGLSLLAVGCVNQSAESSANDEKVHKLVILHTNDHHGRFWHNAKGEYGMAARKTLIDDLRAEAKSNGQELILLSGGDINTGIPESDMQYAEPDFKGMSKIGYDAMALGNHEFDNPLSVLADQISWSNFPLLSANIIDTNTGKYAYQPYTIIKKGEIEIAIVGLTTTDTAVIGNPDYISHLSFTNPTAATTEVMKEINRKYSPDINIAVTHMGHFANAKHGINAPGDVTLARGLVPGLIDVIIGGHSQEPVCMESENVSDTAFKPGSECKPDQQNGTWIMQAHEWGKYVGKAELEIRGDDITLVSYQLIPVNLTKSENGKTSFIQPEIKKDKALYNFLLPYQKKGEGQILKPIAQITHRLEGDRNEVRMRQTNLGHLIAAAQMEKVEADFGVISSGGIRNSIQAGEVNYKDVLSVHPFKNRLMYVDMLGKDIAEYLSIIASFPPDSGAYAQLYGVSLSLEGSQATNIQIQGKPLQLDQTYRFSINSYNAAGGDGYPALKDKEGFVGTNYIDAEVLRDYLIKYSPLDTSKFQP